MPADDGDAKDPSAPDPFVTSVLGPCPVPREDPAYEAWCSLGRFLGEGDLRIRATLLERAAKASTGNEFGELLGDLFVQRVDLIARLFLLTVTNYDEATSCQNLTGAATQAALAEFQRLTAAKPRWTRNGEYARLKTLLAQRAAHWDAEALAAARQRAWPEMAGASPQAPNESAQKGDASDTPTTATRAPEYPTALGRNIDRLRSECGWSFDELATKSGLDKKAIMRHVKGGTSAYPRTLKIYADTFTKALNRVVTADELDR
jgi:hypothetical protein